MSKPSSFGKLDVHVVSSLENGVGVPNPDRSFQIVIPGDFSGRKNRGIFEPSSLPGRRFIQVDRDNLDDVMERLGVEIHCTIGNGSPTIFHFKELDDFHPDRIFEELELFRSYRKFRKEIADPQTFTPAIEKVRNREGKREENTSKRNSRFEEGSPEFLKRGLLDQVLEKTEKKPQQVEPSRDEPTGDSSGWDAFLDKIVKPYLLPNIDAEQANLLASIDTGITNFMRIILHHPDFQAMESAWRGLYFLIRKLQTDEHLKVFLLDISKEELAADLCSSENIQSTGTYRLLVEQATRIRGSEPFALMAGIYTFDKSKKDIKCLERMAKIARRAGASFISAAHPRILGCESLAETPDPEDWQRLQDQELNEAWQAMRRLPEASYLGLLLPRFLLRLPYGRETDPAEQFDFEEMPPSPEHDMYLWGNPSFFCACLLGQTFTRAGWSFRYGRIRDIDGFPLHIYRKNGETGITPCAEVLLTEHAAERIANEGIMPLLTFKNSDVLRLARIQSLSEPIKPLAGMWDCLGT